MEDSSKDSGIAKNILVGYFVLILHVLLLVLLGLFIVFFRGLITYMPWILGGGLALLLLSALWFYRRMKRGQTNLRETIRDTVPQNRPVEISLLGGLASMRLGSTSGKMVAGNVEKEPLQLEDPETSRLRSLDRLMEMYNKELITKEEFALLKQDVLKGFSATATANDNANDNVAGDIIDVDFTSQ
ncbi:MAG: hypothetical protein B6I36_06145 [Desulfobacteraceae bacterium 4572_35.1]|nr:MAG: hypothetical protein B6I36_06145 [Desulfobacteraceae bacterium 4572_35.1]